jgi:hypothetical protein
MGGITIKLTGLGEVDKALKDLEADFGVKESSRKVLVPAVRESLRPVLTMAKSLAPKETGALAATLQIEARKPTSRDMRSKYISRTDTVVGMVTTKAFPKKLKKQFYEQNVDLLKNNKKAFRKKFQQYAYSIGFPYDARAIVQEFGSATVPATPFLRPALEANAQSTVTNLGQILARRINQFRSKR